MSKVIERNVAELIIVTLTILVITFVN